VINNVERVSNLFLSKTAYAVVMTLLIGIVGSPFPLLPRQLTLIGTFSIGIPGFFLALAPEVDLVRPGFLGRVLRFSVPAGVVAGLAALAAFGLSRSRGGLDLAEARSLTTVTLLAIGLVILATVSRPLRPWKVLLVAAMGAGYAVILAVPFLRNFFQLQISADAAWWYGAAAVVVAGTAIALIPSALQRIAQPRLGASVDVL
jgi:cation-transporting ATPase E